MKWFFILMVMLQNDPSQDNLYLIEDPKFATPEECLAFVNRNMPSLFRLQTQNFPGQDIDGIYCLTRDAMDKIIKDRGETRI